MRAVLQRVSRARVSVTGDEKASIGVGLLVLLAAGQGDSEQQVKWMSDKIANLRIFPDRDGLMNRSLLDIEGEMLVVSQFTLYGDCRKGRRPSFINAMQPEPAAELCELFVERIKSRGLSCRTGVFGANMQVELLNDGPVTLIIDSSISRRQSSRSPTVQQDPA